MTRLTSGADGDSVAANESAGAINTPPVFLSDKDIEAAWRLEAESICWQQLMAPLGSNYHRVTYEHLLNGNMADFSQRACEMIRGDGRCASRASLHTLQLHSSTCESRIANWKDVARKLNGSLSVQACRSLLRSAMQMGATIRRAQL